jgi:CRP/FNR family cyclic AMP-dependent transcriptional regulator
MISNSPLFSELSEADIDFIANRGTTKSFPRNTILINEGDESDFLCVILEGQVKVYASEESGKEVILNIQGPGEYFGELSLIDEVPRSASVMTLKPSRLVFISRGEFEACLVNNPLLALKLIRSLTQRIRALTEVVKNLALHDVYGRVARTLLKLAHEQDGVLVIDQRFTHQDLANMVGASREMVSRILKDLHTGGYIDVKNRVITISGKLPPAW